MELKVRVDALGPVKNAELSISIPSLTVFYGSNVSGKSLVGLTTSALLQVYALAFAYEEIGRLLGSENLVDLAATILGREPLDIHESIRIERGKIIEEPKTLRELWPDLSPEERLTRYVGIMIINNSLAPYYGWLSSSLYIDVAVELDSSSIRARGILPVATENDIDLDRLKNFVLELEGRKELAIGLSLMDPYNEFWSSSSPSSRIVRNVLNRSDIYVLLLRRGSKLEILYSDIVKALEESLKLSGYPIPSISLSLDAKKITFRLGDVEIPQDMFSKGLRSLISTLSYAICAHILSSIGFNTVVYLDEPEASLDTYMVYTLPLALADSLSEGIAFVLSTHREEVVLGIELLKRKRRETIAEVYEFLYDEVDRCFKPKRARYDEVLERIRIRRLEELELKLAKQCTAS